MQSLTGQLLVASSTVDDPIYSRGVCLLVHQDEEATIGVMLNRPLRPDPAALTNTSDPASPRDPDQGGSPRWAAPPEEGPSAINDLIQTPIGPIHFGGPISGPVVAIHQLSQFAEAETGEGIYVAAEKHHLEGLVREKPCPYRLIVGHLGWNREQLQRELDAGVWHQVPATADIVFCNPEGMWPGLIRRATSHAVADWLKIPDAIGAAELN